MRLTLSLVVLCTLALPARAAVLRQRIDLAKDWGRGGWTGSREKVPGYPEVPVVTAKVLLPYGEALKRVELHALDRGELRQGVEFPVVPFPRPMCQGDFAEPEAPRFVPGQAYPSEHSGPPTVVTLHGYRIAYVPVYPLRLLPASREAMSLSAAELVVETEPAQPSPLYRGKRSDRDEVVALVGNSAELTTYPARAETRGTDYLVIGPADYLDDTDATSSIKALLEEKNKRGVTTMVHNLEDILQSGRGRDAQEKIRNAIIDHYKEDGVKFVLLVGNGYSILPTKKLKVNMSEGTIYSDYYYACLDGDFSNSASTSDLACEVAVGRLPASSLDDVHAFVTKTLKMIAVKNEDDRVWSTLMIGEKLDGSTLGSKVIEHLATGGHAAQVETKGYPDFTSFTQLYETFSKSIPAADIIRTISEGSFYTINHLGHANESNCMKFSTSRIPEVTNSEPFFGITQGCHPGNMKGKNWASLFVVSPHGGPAALVANSNYGFYNGKGSDDGPSNHFHMVFYDTIFRDGERNLGRIHYKAKEKMIPEVTSSQLMRWVVYETNLFGDPELELRF